MSMVLTFRAGKFAACAATVAAVLAGLAACSREQQDWRSAEASDTVEAYGDFLKDHPDSGLVRQARARLTQLSEDRAWNQAGSADTVDAYEQFLAQYPNGKWSQEAHIRVENFELAAAGTAVAGAIGSGAGAAVPSDPASGSTGTLAQAPAQSTSLQPSAAAAQSSAQLTPGEAAQLPTPSAGAVVESPRPSTYPTTAGASYPGIANASASAGTAAGVTTPGAPPVAANPAMTSAPTTPSSIAAAWRSADPTSYGVQLGAFASENAATGEWQQLVERFNAQLRGLAPRVVSAETATGRLFRLQALVADEATARALCDMLRKQSQACVPVLPH
jgi:SPOR domain